MFIWTHKFSHHKTRDGLTGLANHILLFHIKNFSNQDKTSSNNIFSHFESFRDFQIFSFYLYTLIPLVGEIGKLKVIESLNHTWFLNILPLKCEFHRPLLESHYSISLSCHSGTINHILIKIHDEIYASRNISINKNWSNAFLKLSQIVNIHLDNFSNYISVWSF